MILTRRIVWFFFLLNVIFCYMLPDWGLVIMHRSGVLSYSWLWGLLNPGYWTLRWYNLYLLIPQTLVLFFEWYLVQRQKLHPYVFLASQMTGVIWRLMQMEQEITVTLFSGLAAIFPPLALLSPLQKFPWTLAPTHETTQALPCFDWTCFGYAHFIRYWILVFWTIFPVVYWSWAHKSTILKYVSKILSVRT